MTETWGNLEENERKIIASRARKLSDTELQDRFEEKDDVVVFKIHRKTDRSLAGVLDMDREDEENHEELPEDAVATEEAIEEEKALEEEIQDHEIFEVALISPEDFDYEPEITDEENEAARVIDDSLSDQMEYYAQDTVVLGEEAVIMETEAESAGLPSIIDHRPDQSPIKNQGSRGTCVAHASLALIEAYNHIPDDLSEQCAHYKFNEFLGRPHNVNAGLKTTMAAPFLARSDGRVCLESDWPYLPTQTAVDALVALGTYGPPQACQNNETYGYGSYKIISDRGLVGESIKNTRYLEALLYQGYNVVVGTWVSWDDKDNNGVLDPVLDRFGKPIGRGGHAMLIVGYNRPGQYFIVKNSWGRGWGHNGYAYLHYNLARSCFKYGFVVHDVVPPAPTQLPSKLARAPYSTQKISRSKLRSAILFFKTSKGRFAVCEAHAGYNLYLKNLRVYNADGSKHLEKDSLIIRGTYLCDIDSGRETSNDADFWWEAVRPGLNYLVPRNNAAAHVAFDFSRFGPTQISATNLTSAPIPFNSLDYAVVVGRTTANRRFKMIAHAKPGNKLKISVLELYNSLGRRYRYKQNISVPSSWTYNLDTLRPGGGRYADIWWHVISDGVGYLEKYSYAKTQLIWHL